MSAPFRPKRRRNVLAVVLAVGFAVPATGCTVSTTNNSGICDAQGGGNTVSCAQPSTAASSPAPSDSPKPFSSATPAGSPTTGATALAASGSGLTSQYLSDLDSVANSGWLLTGTPEVNGQYYPNSVVQYFAGPGTATVSYNLGRQWGTLDMTLGLSDKSPESALVEFQVMADGQTIYTGRFTLGQSKHVRLSVAHVLRLQLATTLLSHNYWDVYADWCSAKLLS